MEVQLAAIVIYRGTLSKHAKTCNANSEKKVSITLFIIADYREEEPIYLYTHFTIHNG